MKYKLLKKVPMADIGDIIRLDKGDYVSKIYLVNAIDDIYLCDILNKDTQEWLEEVKENKTIYDLKEGDEYFSLELNGEIIKRVNTDIENSSFHNYAYTFCFLTEREAKRNKLLRELATRTTKYLPKNNELFCTFHSGKPVYYKWTGNTMNYVSYHRGFAFKNEEEYNKYINEQAKDLLFNI